MRACMEGRAVACVLVCTLSDDHTLQRNEGANSAAPRLNLRTLRTHAPSPREWDISRCSSGVGTRDARGPLRP